jgi:solute carrier family 25 iron transporter 28/37
MEAVRDQPAVDIDWEEWDGSMPFWKHAIAGSCAGVMEHVGMYPLDNVKTHMQVLRHGERVGLREVLREIIGDQGVRGFMRGVSAIAVGTIPAHVALFTSYEFTKKTLLEGREHDPLRAAACGATSTFCHDLFLTPMDVVKQRMQLGNFSTVRHCFFEITRREGVAALFRSMPTTLIMNLPFGSVLVGANETIKDYMGLEHVSDRRTVLPLHFFSAGLSGALAALVTQPLDVVKTRLQTQDCLARSTSSLADGEVRRPRYKGFVGTLNSVVREEGFKALYRGVLPRTLYTMPAAAICWGTYESVKSCLA